MVTTVGFKKNCVFTSFTDVEIAPIEKLELFESSNNLHAGVVDKARQYLTKIGGEFASRKTRNDRWCLDYITSDNIFINYQGAMSFRKAMNLLGFYEESRAFSRGLFRFRTGEIITEETKEKGYEIFIGR